MGSIIFFYDSGKIESKSNVIFHAHSLGSQQDSPTSHNSTAQLSDNSVSSSSSLTPTSGYSSYDILDQDSEDDLPTIFQSCHDYHQTKNRASKEAVSDSRSKSVPIISRKTNTQDYTTQIKPASHRLENHSCSSSAQSSVSTPLYSGREARTFREKREGSCNRKNKSNINGNINDAPAHNVQIWEASNPR